MNPQNPEQTKLRIDRKKKKVFQLEYKNHLITVTERGYAGCPTTGFKCLSCNCFSSSVNTNPPENYLEEEYIKKEFNFFHKNNCCNINKIKQPKVEWEELPIEWDELNKLITDDEKKLIQYAQDIWDRDWVEQTDEKRTFINLFRSILKTQIEKAKQEARAEVVEEVIKGIEQAEFDIIGLDQKKADLLHAMNLHENVYKAVKKELLYHLKPLRKEYLKSKQDEV